MFISATAPQLGGPFPYGDKTDSGRVVVGAKAEAVVVNSDSEAIVIANHADRNVLRAAVLYRVADGFLRNAISGNLDGDRQSRKIT